MLFVMILGSVGVMAQDTGACEEWGTVQPAAETTINFGETVNYFVGDRDCGNSNLCNWSLEPSESAELSTTEGGSVQLTAQSDLGDCVPLDVLLSVTCPEDDGSSVTGDHTIEVYCSEAQKESILGTQNWTIGGGGCGTSTLALAFVPIVSLYRRRR